MDPQNTVPGTPQQQVVDRLKTAVNVLVTVSNNPSVDQLSAAIGFTLLLNKQGKHATAVFSGQVPSTIEFLKPEATIEKNTDSLRDFIVSLDKSKADKLRYKVEQNVVKIFITPYRTSLSEKDLEFSQGDFNVDAVVALGVKEREQLDQAIVAHGRILHDATVITISAGNDNSSLGAINWQDTNASSLCEMLVGVGDAIQPGSLDNQIATAFLTGIVAETERFRNHKTTPKIMTLSAQLMAAGANQQLIASQLEHEVDLQQVLPNSGGTAQNASPEPDGALAIEHPDASSEAASTEPVGEPEEDPKDTQIAIDEHGDIQLPLVASESDGSEAAGESKSEAGSSVVKQRHMIVDPAQTGAEQTKEERFAGGPHPLTANIAEDGLDEPNINPLSVAEPPQQTTPVQMPASSPSEGLEPAATPAPTPAPMPEPYAAKPEPTFTPVPVSMPNPEPTFATAPVLEPTAPVPTPAPEPAAAPEPQPEPEPATVAPSEPANPEDILTIPPALDDKTIRDIEKDFDSQHIAKDPTSTIDEIEEVEHSPHADAEEAREAVQDALNATPYNTNRPEPTHALNAASVDLNQALPPSNDPVLAGLGLTDNVAPPSASSILPPAPGSATPAPPTDPAVSASLADDDEGAPPPPPVPPPFLPMQ